MSSKNDATEEGREKSLLPLCCFGRCEIILVLEVTEKKMKKAFIWFMEVVVGVPMSMEGRTYFL